MTLSYLFIGQFRIHSKLSRLDIVSKKLICTLDRSRCGIVVEGNASSFSQNDVNNLEYIIIIMITIMCDIKAFEANDCEDWYSISFRIEIKL